MLSFTAPDLGTIEKRLKRSIDLINRAANSALSSLGFHLKREAKEAIKRNTLGWRDLAYSSRILQNMDPIAAKMKAKPTNKGTRLRAWGALGDLVVYTVDKAQQVMTFGFQTGTFGKKTRRWKRSNGTFGSKRVANVVGENAMTLARKVTDGSSIRITPKMQRFLAGLGFGRKVGSVIDVPARPLVGPVFRRNESTMRSRFRRKFNERMAKYLAEIDRT
jgi:hypothetical protein